MNSLDELIVVAGPTASGKTHYAIELAKKIDGVIINADSMQVYRGMDIGTNKGEIKKLRDLGIKIFTSVKLRKGNVNRNVDGDENQYEYEINAFEIENSGVVGYMFDIVNPDEEFTLAHYQYLVAKLLENFKRQGQKVILVGGTGLYIDSIIKNYSIDEAGADNKLRDELNELSSEQLYDVLYEIDEESALSLNQSDRANKRRLVRRIELAKSNSKPSKGKNKSKYKMYYPIYEREQLYEKINNRVDEMLEEGLIEEVQKLINKGYKNVKSMQGMGYKEVADYLEGKLTLEEVKSHIKQAHRNYASRQITWFENKSRGYNLVRVGFEE